MKANKSETSVPGNKLILFCANIPMIFPDASSAQVKFSFKKGVSGEAALLYLSEDICKALYEGAKQSISVIS